MTLVAGEYHGDEWEVEFPMILRFSFEQKPCFIKRYKTRLSLQLEEPLVEEYGEKEWARHR